MVSRGVRWKSEIQGKGVVGLKIRYKSNTVSLCLTQDKIYEVISEEKGWYRIIDDSGEDYLYPPELFEIVKGDENGVA